MVSNQNNQLDRARAVSPLLWRSTALLLQLALTLSLTHTAAAQQLYVAESRLLMRDLSPAEWSADLSSALVLSMR